MIELSLQTLSQLLSAQVRKIYIGYSGGIDSQVLLHLCAAQFCYKDKIIAVYIHHGLQAAADDWELHCRRQCLNLGVDFKTIKVNAAAKPGQSPEAAARAARYAAFQELLQPGDVLLLAQHREDQMETLLLQLFRGSGLHGLAAMPESMIFGQGLVLRPFLNVAKQTIRHYACRHELEWVEDPSNLNSDLDRNFLRNQIVPLLKQRWPALDKTVARSAKHCADAGQLLDDWMAESFASIFDPLDQSLLLDKWRQFNHNQKNWLLRYWLQSLGLRPTSQGVLQTIVERVICARDDASPEVQMQGYFIRKYRHKLFCIPGGYFSKESAIREWTPPAEELQLVNGFRLRYVEEDSGIDKQLWLAQTVTVGYRRGGERIKLPGREGHHCLKKLYQEAGIPPWERDMRPLVFLGGRLAAVADLWVAEWAWRREGACYRLLWQR